jgi:UDP-glucose 4-epimerase
MESAHKDQKLAVVTGGAGFVGSHLAERLVREGYHVISLDNYFTGSVENHVKGVEYRTGHTKDIALHIPETPDIIYHLGEYSRVHKSIEEPELVWDMNIGGTVKALEFWRTHKCKFVYAASSTKTAGTKGADGTEGKDLTPYTWAKAVNSDLVHNYGRWYGLPYAITYFYNVYGPRERAWGDYGTVVETFRQNMLAGKPHEVNAPGTQTRAFTHVSDTVNALVSVGEKGMGDNFYISAQKTYTIKNVAEMFGGEIIMKQQTTMSRSSGVEDISKLRALGWEPAYDLKDYIENCKQQRL